MTLGNKIYQLRTKAGLSQEELAEQTGVSRQSVSKWETDASIPELDKLIQLSKLFGVTLDSLVQEEGEQTADNTSDTVLYTAETQPSPAPQSIMTPRRIVGIILFALGLIGVFVSLFFLNDNTVDNTAVPIMILSLFCIPCGLLCVFVKKHFLLSLIVLVSLYTIITVAVLSMNYILPQIAHGIVDDNIVTSST